MVDSFFDSQERWYKDYIKLRCYISELKTGKLSIELAKAILAEYNTSCKNANDKKCSECLLYNEGCMLSKTYSNMVKRDAINDSAKAFYKSVEDFCNEVYKCSDCPLRFGSSGSTSGVCLKEEIRQRLTTYISEEVKKDG